MLGNRFEREPPQTRMSFSRNLKRADHLLRRWAEEPIGVAVPFLAFLAVWLPPQMPDMFAGMELSGTDVETLLRPLLFAIAATLLGLSAWFWTRAALTAQRAHGETDSIRLARGRGTGHPQVETVGEARLRHTDSANDHEDWSHEWAPRLALLAAGGITLLPILFFFDGGRLFSFTFSGTVLGLIGMELLSFGLVGLLFVFVVHRTRFRWVQAFDAPAWMLRYRPTRILACAPFGWPFAILSLASSLAALCCLIFAPEWVAMLDAPTAAIASLAFAVGPLVIALALFRAAVEMVFDLAHWIWHGGRARVMIPGERHRVKRLSNALGTIAMLAWFLSPPWVLEKHTVPLAQARVLEPFGAGECPSTAGGSVSHACRPDLKTALQQWVASRRTGDAHDQRLPVIIVAAEGGASRAAAWLLSSLRMLDHQTHGEAGRHIFAISGVSGGSLGAASYMRLLAAHGDSDGRLDWDDPEVRAALRALSTRDLLAATISTYFLSDMFGSLIGPLWTASGVPDRNAALELSFNLLWKDGFSLPGGVPSTLAGLHAEMAQRRRGQADLPHLLLNGSDVKTGRRILTSSIRTTADPGFFPDSSDFIKLTNRDISLATAVTNSARFPFVSPAGRFHSVTERKDYQVIDGGYFENYGARTAWELARAIEDLNATDPGLNVVPVVVIVSNDLEADQPPRPARSGECRSQLGDTREDGMQITVRCDAAGVDQSCSTSEPAARRFRAEAYERSLVPQSMAPFLGLASTRSSHGRDALNIVKRDFCRPPVGTAEGPSTRMIHIAMPKPAREEDQSAPMNWVLSPYACDYMMNVAPWIGHGADEGLDFNLGQARALEATLAAISQRDKAIPPSSMPRPIDCGLEPDGSGQERPRVAARVP